MSGSNNDDRPKGGSILSSGSRSHMRSAEVERATEILAERHRRAKMRRQAAESPLMQALSRRDSGTTGLKRGSQDNSKSTLRDELLAARRARKNHSVVQSGSLLNASVGKPASRTENGPRPVPDESVYQKHPRPNSVETPAVSERNDDAEGFENDRPRDDFQARSSGHGTEAWQPLIDPMEVIRGILRSKLIIVTMTILGALLGVMVALNTPKTYVSTAEVLVDPRDIRVAEKELTIGGLPSNSTLAIIENQVRVMYSNQVLRTVVDRLRLDEDPEFNGTGGGFSPRAIISNLRSLVAGSGGSSGQNRREALATENLAKSLTIARGGKTFVVSVSAKTRDPDKSAMIVTTLVEVFIDKAGAIQSRTAGQAESELTSRLSRLRDGVQKAELAVENFKASNDLVDAQGRLISDDQIVKINDQLTAARAKTIELKSRTRSIREMDASSILSASLPEYVNSAVLSELRSQYARLAQQSDALAVKLGPRHPDRQAITAQIAGARRQIGEELRRIASSLQVELRRAVEQEQELATRLARAKARQSEISDSLVQLRELEREAAAQRAVYENFLLRARDAGEQKGLNTANISVISPAEPPLLSSGKSRAMISVTGMILGFILGVGIGGMRGVWTSFSQRNRMSSGRGNAMAQPSWEHAWRDSTPPYPSGPRRRRKIAPSGITDHGQPAPQSAPHSGIAENASVGPVVLQPAAQQSFAQAPAPMPSQYVPASPVFAAQGMGWPTASPWQQPPYAGMMHPYAGPPAMSAWPQAIPFAHPQQAYPGFQSPPDAPKQHKDDAFRDEISDLRHAVRQMQAKVRDYSTGRRRA